MRSGRCAVWRVATVRWYRVAPVRWYRGHPRTGSDGGLPWAPPTGGGVGADHRCTAAFAPPRLPVVAPHALWHRVVVAAHEVRPDRAHFLVRRGVLGDGLGARVRCVGVVEHGYLRRLRRGAGVALARCGRVRAGPGTAVRSRPGAVRVTCWWAPRCHRWRCRPGSWFPAR